MSKSCYIHIPFCKKICNYCDFCKVFYDNRLVNSYLSSLKNEIKTCYQEEVLNTIYIGGGTPSSLNYHELEQLFKTLTVLKRTPDVEFTIECNFDSIDKEKLLLFKKYGVNRLSFGLETTDTKSLTRINRDLDLNHVKDIIKFARSIGFNNINLDLMYGYSFSSLAILKKDLDFILSLDVEHISTYSLIVSPHTKFYLDKVTNISDDKDLEMYHYIHDTLLHNGYKHYEISNFAKPGYESKHNLVYWKNEQYYGFGVSASSYLNNKRITNTKSITHYIDGHNKQEIEILSKTDKMIYEMILGLRLKEGINIQEFKNKYGIYPSEVFNYQDLVKQNKIVVQNDHLYVPFSKWYVLNNILINFIEVNYE